MTDITSQPVWVIIPAAGVGKRMQLDLPKQYFKINNKTIIEHTLGCFLNHPDVAGIVVALESEDPYWKQLQIDTNGKPTYTVEGGKERSDSVMQALDYLTMVERVEPETWVMVHDAARPCLSYDDINALLEVRGSGCVGGILASPVRDTMKRSFSDKNEISQTESRNDLWHALTPQLFKIGQLKSAIETCIEKDIEVTDEASAIEAMGEHPMLIEGSHNNIKITHPSDIGLATWFLSETVEARGK